MRAKVIRIEYGLPSYEAYLELQRGKVALGGCVIEPDSTTHLCSGCGAEFVRAS